MHALLNLTAHSDLQHYPKMGSSWEGFALEQVIQIFQADAGESYFWATHAEAELDLLLVQGTQKIGFEFKYTSTPKTSRSMHSAFHALSLERLEVGSALYHLSW